VQLFKPNNIPINGRQLIEASAGTGKTFALMSIAIRMIAIEGRQARELILMTFTRASTRELRARIRERIMDELAALQNNRSELFTLYPKMDPLHASKHLEIAARELDDIEIQTIHGFAIKVLSELGPIVQINPATLIDDTELLLQEAALDVYRDLRNKNEPELLQQVTGGLPRFVQQSKLALKPVDIWSPPGIICPDLHQAKTEYQQRVRALTKTRDDLKKAPGIPGKTIDKYCDQAESAPGPWAIDKTTVDYFKKKGTVLPQYGFDEWANLSRPTEIEIQFLAFALRQVRTKYLAILSQRGLSDQDQIVEQAARVAQLTSSFLLPKHRVVLVDEFQDTDRHQWTMLDALYPDTTDRLFVMVGDPKQAIYRFRGADTGFYFRIRNQLTVKARWTLDTVYRSAETIIQGLNTLYDPAHTVGKRLESKNMRASKRQDIQSLTLNGNSFEGFQWCEGLNAEQVVALVVQLTALGQESKLLCQGVPVEASDIGILVQGRELAKRIKRGGEEKGLLFHYADRNSVFTHAICREMVAIFEAIANPGNLNKIASAGTTSIAGLDLRVHGILFEHPRFQSFQQTIIKARELWYQDGPTAAITQILAHCKIPERLPRTLQGLEDWTDLSQCLEIFGDEATGLSPFEAARWWMQQATDHTQASDTRKPRTPSREGLVTIGTIHGAKGLEYPIVIVAGEIKTKILSSQSYAFDYCTDDGLTLDFRPQAIEFATLDQTEDIRRLTYVALTRARHAVFCALPRDKTSLDELYNHREITDLGIHHALFEISPISTSEHNFQPPIDEQLELNQAQPSGWFFRSFSSMVRHDLSPDRYIRAKDEYVADEISPRTGSNWHGIPGGVETGNFIHEILEYDSRRNYAKEEREQLIDRLWPAHLERHFFPEIVKWITSIRETFLPPGISLSNLVLTQKRPEPQFQLPLKPGLTTEALFQSFASLPWWISPSELPHGSLEGQLIGFIDLVYEAENRFYILDYKTNMLGETGANYTSEIITQTMLASHYQAQAAIYGLALHRWLTQRKPGYDPNQHLGSAVYLFCRGIDGPSKGIWSAPLDANAILEIEARCLDAPTH